MLKAYPQTRNSRTIRTTKVLRTAQFAPLLIALILLPGERIIPVEVRRIQTLYPGWEIYELGTPNSQIPKKFRYGHFQKLDIKLNRESSQLEFNYVLVTNRIFPDIDIEAICLDQTGNRLGTGRIGGDDYRWMQWPSLSPDGKPFIYGHNHTLPLTTSSPPQYVVFKDFSKPEVDLYGTPSWFDRVYRTFRNAFFPPVP